MLRLSLPLSQSLVIAALLGGLVFNAPAYAQMDQQAPTAAEAQAQPSKGSKGMMMRHKDVETRIKELHDKLKITDEQKDAWNNVADTMRENENTIRPLIQARHEKSSSRSAIEDLESYQKIAAAHAEGLEKFIPVFKTLYDSMSDEQKKNADKVFGHFEGRMAQQKAAVKSGKATTKTK